MPPPSTHIIITPQGEGRQVLFFRLVHLDEFGLFQRVLVPDNDRRYYAYISRGFTCRAARYDPARSWTFNGRTGDSKAIEAGGGGELELPAFATLSDTRTGLEKLDSEATAQFASQPTAVEKWMGGVLGQIDPNTKPDAPGEARKLNAQEVTFTAFSARPRVPKGFQTYTSESDSDDGFAVATPSSSSAFASLLGSTDAMKGSSLPSEDGSDSDDTAQGFQSLLLGGKTAKSGTPDQSEQSDESPMKTTSALVCSQQASIISMPHETAIVAGHSGESFPSNVALSTAFGSTHDENWNHYGKKYARTDDVGLTSDANSVAEWEINHNVDLSPGGKARSKPPVLVPRRPAHLQSSGRSVIDDNQTRRTAPSASYAPSMQSTSTIQKYSQYDSTEANWYNKKGEYTGPSLPKLVDDSEPNASLSNKQPVTLPHVSLFNGLAPTEADEERVIDRLAPRNNDTGKKDTMGQKAKSKSKGKKPVKSFHNVQLELPDPIPSPAKPKQRKVEEKPQTAPPTHPQLKPSTKITSTNHEFGALLSQLKLRKAEHEEDDDDVIVPPMKLIAHFGTLLTLSHGTKFSHDPSDPIELQSFMRQSLQGLKTAFLPRLTATTADADRLVKIATGPEVGTVTSTAIASYDIHIQDSSGQTLKVTMLAADKTDFSITSQHRVLGTAHSHFPVHVFDAQYTLFQPGHDMKSESEQAICEFIASMATDMTEPSFFAMVPNGAFTVQAVIARQQFTYQIGGICFEMTRYQHLLQENFSGRRHNFRALALDEDEMVNGQRLWWEARLVTEDLEQADQIQAKVNEMVAAMDSIGLENECYWSPNAENQELDDVAVEEPDLPFW